MKGRIRNMRILRQEFQTAFDRARDINKILSSKNEYVWTDDIIEAIKASTHFINIIVLRQSFSQTMSSEYHQSFSLLNTQMQLDENGRQKWSATILLNTDHDVVLQRFALVQALGQLATGNYDFMDQTQHQASNYVNADIGKLLNKAHKSDAIWAEELANIFAVLVLVPERIKIDTLKETEVGILAKKYGVPIEAIYSKLILSHV